jgi:hypothetical protein
MDVQEVEVTIGADGKVQIHVRGVSGPACLALTADLEAALGGAVIQREPTAAMFETPSDAQTDQTLGQGG